MSPPSLIVIFFFFEYYTVCVYLYVKNPNSFQVLNSDGTTLQLTADTTPVNVVNDQWKFVFNSSSNNTCYYQIINQGTNQAIAYTAMGENQPLALVSPNLTDSKQLWSLISSYRGNHSLLSFCVVNFLLLLLYL